MNELEKAQAKLLRLKASWKDVSYHTKISERTLLNISEGSGAQYRTVRAILDYTPPKKAAK